MARDFIRQFKPGSYLENEEFDLFLARSEHVVDYQPEQRGQWAEKLRAAGSQPRILKEGDPSFTLWSDHKGGWFVEECLVFISRGRVLEDQRSFNQGLLVKLRHLSEGVDLENVLKTNQNLGRVLKMDLKIQYQRLVSANRQAEEDLRSLLEVATELDVMLSRKELPAHSDRE